MYDTNIYDHLNKIFNNNISYIVFELGAHQGTDTEKLINIFPTSIYYAFEPDSRNIKTLKDKGLDKKINLIEAAITDRDGEMTLYQSSGNPPYRPKGFNHTASSSIKKPKNAYKLFPWLKFTSCEQVKTYSLDSFCKQYNINNIDFIWADIQGSERELIFGGKDILSRTKYIYTEYSNDEVYEGEYNLGQIIFELPGDWKIIDLFKRDVLLKNINI